MGKIKKICLIYWRDFYLNFLAASVLVPNSVRFYLYRIYGLRIYTKRISPKSFIGNRNIYIGKNTFVNYSCFFNTAGGINIGDNCDIGYQVTFCTSSHEIGNKDRRAGESISLPIVIGNGTWIGARSMILPGVSIGEGCIIAAGSVVIKDCFPNGLYAGVPAKRIKELIE